MSPTAILYPGIAMFFLTLGAILYLGYGRYTAIHQRTVSMRYYRTFDEGDQTPRLHLVSRHVQNHFEVPPLFYLAILFTFVSGTVSPVAVGLAWGFVLARCVHAAIHLGPNDVSARFFTFGTSLLILAGLWIHLLVALLTREGA